jgi:hypothetical protein
VTNSWFMISATMPRTVRVMMPIGMTERVTAGRTRCLICSQSQPQSEDPPGPAPMAGSQLSCTEKITTITMPSQ